MPCAGYSVGWASVASPGRAVCVLALPGGGSLPSPGGGSWGSQPPVALPSESCSALRSLVLSDRMLTLAVEARVFPRLCWCLCAGVSALTPDPALRTSAFRGGDGCSGWRQYVCQGWGEL